MPTKSIHLLLAVVVWTSGWGSAIAQPSEKPAGTNNKEESRWIIRTFRVSPVSLRNTLPLAIGETIPPSPPGTKSPVLSDFPFSPSEFLALPPANASEKEWEAHIQRTSTVLAGILESLGAPGLRDSAFLYDARSCTLVVRTTKDHLRDLEPVMKWLNSKIPHDLTFVVNVVQADSASIRSLVEETTGLPDHAPTWKRCTEWLATGNARTVGQYRWGGRTGQRAVLKSGQESVPLKALQVDANGRVLAVREEAHSAVYLEADPVDPIDEFSESTLQIVEVPLIFQFDYAPPVERIEKIPGLLGNSTIEAPMLDYEGALLTSKIPMHVGSQRLLAVWRPRGKPEFAAGDVMQAAFLQVDAQPALPPENTSLAALLRKHAGPPPALLETIPGTSRTGPHPDDVYSRTFKVSARFAEALQLSKGESDVKSKLELHGGITFPEGGGEANYVSAVNTLIVRTMHSSHERLEAYLENVSGPVSQLVSTTGYIIEGDSTSIQELTAQPRNNAGHLQVWERAQKLLETNTLRMVEVIRSEARFEARAKFEFGTTRHAAGEILLTNAADRESPLDDKGKEEEEAEHKDKEAKDTSAKQPPAQGRSVPQGNTPVTLQMENSFEGTRIEWEAFKDSEEQEMVTLHLSFYYDTKPTVELQPTPSPGATIPAGLPKTRFHYSSIASATRIRSGTTRLMGSWKKGEATAPDGRDLSQMLFLRVDVIPMDVPEP